MNQNTFLTDTPPLHPAMILAAGLGTRMRAHAPDVPKPLVPVEGRPLLDYALDLLREAGLSGAVVNTHYMAEKVTDYLALQTDLHLTPVQETTLLETGGGVVNALPLLQDRFFVMNSDVINLPAPTAPLLRQMAEKWDDTTMDALLLMVPLAQATGYDGSGDFGLAAKGQLLPKARDGDLTEQGEARSGGCGGIPPHDYYVFSGIQLLHRRFLADAPAGAFSLGMLYRRAVATQPCRIYGMVHPGAWFHVGDGAGVAAAEASGLLAKRYHI